MNCIVHAVNFHKDQKNMALLKYSRKSSIWFYFFINTRITTSSWKLITLLIVEIESGVFLRCNVVILFDLQGQIRDTAINTRRQRNLYPRIILHASRNTRHGCLIMPISRRMQWTICILSARSMLIAKLLTKVRQLSSLRSLKFLFESLDHFLGKLIE